MIQYNNYIGVFYQEDNEKTLDIFIVDERYVPLTHKDNNYKMIKENLLDKTNIPEKNIFPINTQLPLKKSVIQNSLEG